MPNESESKGWWHTLPGILTAIAAVLSAITGLIVAVRTLDQPKAAPPPAAAQATAPRQEPPAQQAHVQPAQAPLAARGRPEPAVRADLTGTWRDNVGNVTRFQQDGASFRFEGYGKACAGNSYRSRGSGTVSGNQIRSTYESTVPSTGNCVGLIDDQGMNITSKCIDSACGTFVSSADKVQ